MPTLALVPTGLVASPLVREKVVPGHLPTALSNSHAAVAHPRGGRRARLALPRFYLDSGVVMLENVTRRVKLPTPAVTHSVLIPHPPRPALDLSGPGRILEDEPLSVTATKKNIRRMTLQLCYFRSRGYIFNLPLPTTAAKHLPAALHAHCVYSSIRKCFNPSALSDHLALLPTQGSSTTLCPGPHAGSTGLARTLPKPLSSPQVLGFSCTSAGPRFSLAAQHTAAASQHRLLLLLTQPRDRLSATQAYAPAPDCPLWPPPGLGSTSLT